MGDEGPFSDDPVDPAKKDDPLRPGNDSPFDEDNPAIDKDEYDYKHPDDPAKRASERRKDRVAERREREEREEWHENLDPVVGWGRRREFNGYLHALAFYLKWMLYVFLAIIALGAVVNPESLGWEDLGATVLVVAIILVINHIY